MKIDLLFVFSAPHHMWLYCHRPCTSYSPNGNQNAHDNSDQTSARGCGQQRYSWVKKRRNLQRLSHSYWYVWCLCAVRRLLNRGCTQSNTPSVSHPAPPSPPLIYVHAEDNMNCQLSGVTMTQKDGRVSRLQNVYLRGSQIRFVVLPDILKNAPIFKRVQQIKQTYDKKKNPNARTKRWVNRHIISCMQHSFHEYSNQYKPHF